MGPSSSAFPLSSPFKTCFAYFKKANAITDPVREPTITCVIV